MMSSSSFSIYAYNVSFPLMAVFFHRMKRKFYSWEECMNLREVKVRTVILRVGYGTAYRSSTPSNLQH